ncbi:cubilin homolog [Phlebotomus argentipes]|uniref:cubilin homolog n=1 Tax=Phlebotomus argentipes TaxID=94469 RepID=UPI00289299D6|nr:cubilin homolog [Phlebotomus argentipes]
MLRIKLICEILLVLVILEINAVPYDSQPKFITEDGNLCISSAVDRNITLDLKGRGRFLVNNLDILQIIQRNFTISDGDRIPQDSMSTTRLLNRVNILYNDVRGPRRGILQRLSRLENGSRSGASGFQPRNLRLRVLALETKMDSLMTKLAEDDCRSNPCNNGGTCVDMFDGFLCHCTPQYQGKTCVHDVNECENFDGTDLGCQNGATCMNTYGSYYCHCAAGFQGVHCTKRDSNCQSASSRELCDHGVCVPSGDPTGYRCICDQGWITNNVTVVCSTDVDECRSSVSHCSRDPPVQCINTPGSYTCGPCPVGYSGSGHYCVDVDECQVNNGGCSINPHVPCINTRGSFTCGSCPLGFSGDGRSCIQAGSGGICQSSPHVCHPEAVCEDVGQSIMCRCKPGFSGDGFGPHGCVRDLSTFCSVNPCLNGGSCRVNATSFVCICPVGTLGPRCEDSMADPCSLQPCANGGTCVNRANGRGFVCNCTQSYTGTLCQAERRSCGGTLTGDRGVLKYPEDGSRTYNHNSRCAWLIRVNSTKILNVTFTKFELENSFECRYDWLQIHDGRSSAYHMIGRFCGNNIRPGHWMTSTHNTLYLWFRSDSSQSRDGFEITWEAIDPVCGGLIDTTSFGVIKSPGSPGTYPPNRDCQWLIRAPAGKRLQFHFFVMQMESHENCEYDYLAVYNGPSLDSPLLEKFCNTSHPPPLTSPSNEITMFFHSDEDSTDNGFQIHYSVVEGFPGCGGVFTAYSGEFGSPVEDEKYPHNLLCEYSIKYPKGSKIRLTFKSFQLEVAEECRFDSLELFEIAADGTRELVKKFCGDTLPKPYKSMGNELLLVFNTDWSQSFGGFRIGYQIDCGGTFEAESGIITSPMYPQPYHDSRVCEYIIQAPIGKVVALQFLDFDLEENSYPDCYYDYVEISDGVPSSNSTKIGRYCGNMSPPTIVSTYNALFLTLETDSSISGRGFKANYTFIDVQCGGIVTTSGTVIRSPESTESSTSYAESVNCRWLISAPAGHNVQITWINFQIESEDSCAYDYVQFFDNSTHPARSVGKFCGSRTPPVINSVETMMTVVFVTDESVNEGSFSFMVTFVDMSKSCGGNFYMSFGYIRSPGYPEPYMNDRQCEWVISVENGAQIELKANSFDLEEHHECEFDYVEVRNGGRADSPLVGIYCGKKFPSTIRSFSNQVYVKFVSDSSRPESGFELEWDGTITGCGGTLTAPRGSIVSPNYPEPYAENAQCIWKITVSAGSVVQIIFSDLDLERSQDCVYDYLEVFDGRDASSVSLGRFCSAEDHPLHLQTSSNFAMIRMRTDYSAQGRGFNLRYNTNCNREIESVEETIIESPNFPNAYPHSLNCLWTIRVPLGNRISITFLHFDLENGDTSEDEASCKFDYLMIEEKVNSVEVVKKTKHCDKAPEHFISAGEVVEVSFVTDISISHTGFRLEFHIEGCGGFLRNPTGSISSPNYPGLYPHHVHCYWLILAPFGHSIELTISDFHLEAADQCSYDGLRIFNSDNMTITTLCHVQTKPTTYTSNGAIMNLYFYTDMSIAGKGFNSSYKFIPQKCGGTLSTQGNIYSPNYPNNYDKASSCEWLLQTDETHVLEINWLDFDLESSSNCQHDSVRLYSGPTMDPKHLTMTWCGSERPNKTQQILATNQALLIFRSDSSVEAKGFHLNFTSACGSRIVTNGSGELVKTYGMYDRVGNCTWTIISDDPVGKLTLTISELDFFKFDVENRTQSILEVFDGDSTNATLLGSYNDAPPTLYSSGNAITLRMNSEPNHELIISGFKLFYSVFENFCGGDLKAESGQFASPMYPKPYPANIECIWNIEASPGNKILVEFSEFILADSPTCSEEYVEIREKNGGGKLLGVFCGSNQPTNLTASESLWIKFRSGSDVINEMRKFYASFAYQRLVEITDKDEGFVTSPLFPSSIYRSIDYKWRITVDFGSVISVSVKDVYILGDCYLYVQIYDGFNEDAPELGEKICGVEPQESVTSSSNVIFIHSNLYYPSLLGSHFRIQWKKVPRVLRTFPELEASVCGMESLVLTKNHTNVNITSPGFPSGYDANLNCTWIVSSDDPAYHPVFVVNYLDLEDTDSCLTDRLVLSQSRDLIVWKQLAQICNIDYRNQQTYYGNPYLKIEFLTDWGMNKTGFRGLLVEDCGGYMTDATGKVSAGVQMLTERYVRFQTTCVWEIHVRQGRTIKFEFQEYYFPKNRENSVCDGFIMFKNGGSEDSPLLGEGKYCGEGQKPDIPETISNRAYVKFEYGGNYRTRFQMTYREVNLACGGTIHLTEDVNSTVITSPNYPNIPHPHTECVWLIFAPNGESMNVDFEERFDLTRSPGCDKEYVELRSGGTTNSELLGNFCNTMPPTISTHSNILRVKYFTDVTDPKNGFKAKVSIASCSATLRQNQGILSSPKYPGKGAYPANSVCTYRIIGSPLTYLNITFVDINLPPKGDNDTCVSDRVSVYAVIPGDSEGTQQQHRGTYCGSEIPESFFIDSHEAVIEFTTTEHQDLYTGFSMRFNVGKETCGAEINAESGIITSPGYPTGRQNRRFCEWSITVPKGRRVKVELLDLDLIPASHTYSQRIGFYHDHRYLSRIRFIKGEDPLQTIYSSGNKMLVNMWVRVPSNHRGFKLAFSSNEPTVCQGDLNLPEGDIESPKNLSTYYCEYIRDAGFFYPEEPTVGTLALRIQDAFIGRSISCRLASTRIAVSWLSGPDLESPYLQYLCGNISDTTVRSPFPDTKLEARQGLYYGPISFRLHHKMHKCGGIINRASEITQPSFPANYGRVDCAWHIRQSSGFAIQLQIIRLELSSSCDDEYINVYNGATQLSPHLMKICGNSFDVRPIMSENNFLFIEYFSRVYNSSAKFTFKVNPAVSGCGGIIHKSTQVIKSPGNSSYYPNNIECIWEFRPDAGFHVGLEFIDRFYIEDSVNCTKDYIEIFDLRSGEWHSLGRVCGRETPPIFNATESELKLVFRTDGSVSGDGFSVKWYQNCGGLYEVRDKTPEIIFSPNYPSNYVRLLNCNYTFVAPTDNYIILDFQDFQLEESIGRCIFDNVTIYKVSEWNPSQPFMEHGVYCRDNSPGKERYKNKVSVVFRTDKWVERKGFKFTYYLDTCGGAINNSTLITSPGFDTMTYPGEINCVWNITAPVSKIILIKFEKMDIESVDTCYGDYVSVFKGQEMKDENRLAKLCGNITTPPAIKTDSSSAILNFKSDLYNNIGGFSAAVLFIPSCDRRITLTKSSPIYHLDVSDSNYEYLLDCHFYIKAPEDDNIRLKFTQFHVAPCDNNSTKTDCSCDFVEIRDGVGPFSELVGKYCGHELPPDVLTSRPAIYIRFVTDSRVNSRGFTAEISTVANPCGVRYVNISDGVSKSIESGPAPYKPNMRCSIIVETTIYEQLHLIFEKFDLQGPNADGICAYDQLEIADEGVLEYKDVAFGQDLVYNGVVGGPVGFYMGTRHPLAHHHYCGNGTPADYVSRTHKVHLNFKSDAEHQAAGFTILAAPIKGCHRNYTETQGRIFVSQSRDCDYLIIVPENYTISLYFLSITFYNMDCEKNGIKVYDGDNENLLGSYCGYTVPDPVFSTTNKLRLSVKGNMKDSGYVYGGSYDLTFLATDAGRGCGGVLYNYGGTFSSPLYPLNERNNTSCEWDVHVPSNLLVAMRFNVFDMGTKVTCPSNYVQLIDVDPDGQQTVQRQYCGDDVPAVYKSGYNHVRVRFVKDVNFAGTGWLLQFMAVNRDAEIYNW